MTYDFNVPATDLFGKEEQNRTLNDVMVEFVGSESSTKENNAKMCYWYETLRSKQPLTLDDVDKKILVDLIAGSQRILVFVKNQLLEVLNK